MLAMTPPIVGPTTSPMASYGYRLAWKRLKTCATTSIRRWVAELARIEPGQSPLSNLTVYGDFSRSFAQVRSDRTAGLYHCRIRPSDNPLAGRAFMSWQPGKLGGYAVALTCVLAGSASAQIDLNRVLFPKVP